MRYFYLPGGHRVWADVATQLSDELDWSPGIWSAPVAASDVREILTRRFPDAAVLEKHPRNYMLPGEYSLRDAKALDEFFASRTFYENQEALLAELDRHTDFRLWSGDGRETSLRLVALKLFNLFEKHSIKALVAAETPHLLMPHLALLIAEHQGLPILFFHPVPYCPTLIPMTGVGKPYLGNRQEWSLARESVDFQTEILSYLVSELDNLEAGSGASYMAKRNKNSQTSPIAFLFAGMAEALKSLVLAPLKIRSILDFQARQISRQILFWRRASLLFSARRTPDEYGSWRGQTASLFLHYEPERNSSPEGRPFHSAVRALSVARATLPDRFLLQVKDHPSQYKERLWGFKRRSELFFKLAKALRATKLLDSNLSGISVIRDSDLVATVNGNVGVEAVLNGKPVLSLGSPWWHGMPGTVSLAEFEPANLPIPPRPEIIRDFLTRRVLENSLVGVSSQKLGKRWNIPDSDNLFWERQRFSLSAVLASFFAEHDDTKHPESAEFG